MKYPRSGKRRCGLFTNATGIDGSNIVVGYRDASSDHHGYYLATLGASVPLPAAAWMAFPADSPVGAAPLPLDLPAQSTQILSQTLVQKS